MAFDYTALGGVVGGVMSDLGFTTQLRRRVDSTPDAPEPTFGTPVDSDIVCVRDKAETKDGTGADLAAEFVYVSAGVVVPQVGDLILLDGVWRSAVEIEAIAPGNVAVMHKVTIDG